MNERGSHVQVDQTRMKKGRFFAQQIFEQAPRGQMKNEVREERRRKKNRGEVRHT